MNNVEQDLLQENKITKTTRALNYAAVGLILLFWFSAFSIYFARSGQAPKIDLNPSLLLQRALSNSIVTLLFVSVFLLLGRERPRDIGFRGKHLVRQLLIGSGFGLALALVDHLVVGNIVKAMNPESFNEGMKLLSEFMGKISIVV